MINNGNNVVCTQIIRGLIQVTVIDQGNHFIGCIGHDLGRGNSKTIQNRDGLRTHLSLHGGDSILTTGFQQFCIGDCCGNRIGIRI